MAPTLVGLLNCGKKLPPQLNLVLEIEWADPVDVVRGGTNTSVDFDIQNVRVLALQVTSSKVSIASGRSLVFSYLAVHTQLISGSSRLHGVQRHCQPCLHQAAACICHIQNAHRSIERGSVEPPSHTGRWHLLPGIADGAGVQCRCPTAPPKASPSTITSSRLSREHF